MGGMVVETHRYESARDLFEAARNAAQENDRTRRMLVAMEEQEGLRGAGTGARVASGSIGDPMSRVDARVDREAAWHRRIEENCELIDLAHFVLYGTDCESGLAALVPSWWCDAIWQHYINGNTWEKTGELVGFSGHRCWEVTQTAFEVADGCGILATMCGHGLAEG